MNTLEIAAIGLQRDLDRLRLTGHNIANLSTPGYKRQILVQTAFEELMSVGKSGLSIQMDARPGKLSVTGQALDVALPQGRYLLVESEDGTQALSRQGALQLDAQGVLRTRSGHTVVGLRGPIRLAADQRAGLEIDSQGQIKHQGLVVGALQLVAVKLESSLISKGEGLYAMEQTDWEPDATVVGVRSGHLEQSNVIPSQEMVNLMGTTRHAETMSRLFQVADDMQATAIRRFGESS